MVVWSLSGGGIKGCFQSGASLAINELRPDLEPDMIAGTSVGAVNAVSLSRYPFEKACAHMLLEYLLLSRRTDMYAISADFNNLLLNPIMREKTPDTRTQLELADSLAGGGIESLLELFIGPSELALSEAKSHVIDYAGVGAGIGTVLGPFGAAVGAILGIYFSSTDAIEELERDFADLIDRLSKMRSFYTLAPIGSRLRAHLPEVTSLRKPVRFESVGLEDGRTYGVDERGSLHIGYDDGESKSLLPLTPSVQNIIDGVLGSAAIPIAFNPVSFQGKSPSGVSRGFPSADPFIITLVDGGVRNTYPILSTLDLVADFALLGDRHMPDLVMIGATEEQNRPKLLHKSAPIFTEGGGDRVVYNPNSDELGTPLLNYAGRAVDIRTGDGIIMGKKLLSEAFRSIIVIEPSVFVIGTAEVDPGLIRIFISYGYLRAADELLSLSSTRKKGFRWSSDWITAARNAIWENEGGFPWALSLHLNRVLYLGVRALLDARKRIDPKANPPSPRTLATRYFDSIGRSPSFTISDLVMSGERWMSRTRGTPSTLGGNPFDSLTINQLSFSLGFPTELRAHTIPASPFPLWHAGTIISVSNSDSSDSKTAVVAGINPFTNKIRFTFIQAPPEGSTSPLITFFLEFPGPDKDHLIGLLDNIGFAMGNSASSTSYIVARGLSGDYWIYTFGGVSWVRVKTPTDVNLRRKDVPREGHTATMLNDGNILITAQTSIAKIIRIVVEPKFGRVISWASRHAYFEGHEPTRYSPGTPGDHEIPVGTCLPCISSNDVFGCALVHSYGSTRTLPGGQIGVAFFKNDEEDVPHYIFHSLDEQRNATLEAEKGMTLYYNFLLTGTSIEANKAALAGIDGDVVRRLKVTLNNDSLRSFELGGNVSECPHVDLPEYGLTHYGRALAISSDNDVIAIVPVNIEGTIGWAWIEGCQEGEEPRVIDNDGIEPGYTFE